MTLKQFIDECVTRLAPLYPAPEAKAIAFRLLEHFTDVPSYKYIAEPDMDIDGPSARVTSESGSCSGKHATLGTVRGRGPKPTALGGVERSETFPEQAPGAGSDTSEGDQSQPGDILRQSEADRVQPGDVRRQSEADRGRTKDLLAALAELETGRPLQYVLGFTEFCGHRFRVREGCLIPRPETEEMVSRIIDDLYADDEDDSDGQPLRTAQSVEPDVDAPTVVLDDDGPFSILDICTGSGCIAWSLAAEFPEAMAYGCDISDAALKIASKQRVKVGGAKPIFFYADVLSAPPAGLPKFDVIVCNPPYICDSERSAMRRNVLDFEPAEALFVPDDDPLRFYRAVAAWADALLRPDGHLYLEINERFGPETAALFPGARVLQDLSGRDRFVVR